ncbi:unnamed protein product [Strongylus vulgaris]|uniref:Uncharacterized protein n=1 Tax=Strongylus vulgaris TaxID=40348 RepID=A0A3P7L6A1_STRVU|nr:unnamed protein product [Strongylus vulgaris]
MNIVTKQHCSVLHTLVTVYYSNRAMGGRQPIEESDFIKNEFFTGRRPTLLESEGEIARQFAVKTKPADKDSQLLEQEEDQQQRLDREEVEAA